MGTRRGGWVAIALAVMACPLRAQAPPIPDLPQVDLTDSPPVVREQVEEAYRAAQSNPNEAGAVGKLGMLLEIYDRPEPAGRCYERAHRLEPDAFRWLYYLGSLRAAQGKRQETTEAFRSALKLDPAYLPAELKLADSLLAAGDWEEAGKVYEGIVRKHPDVAEAHFGLGRVHVARGDLAAAVASYRMATELFPPYGAAHYALALAYRKLGETAKSEEHLKLHAANKNLVPPLPDPLREALRELDKGAASHLRRGILLDEVGRTEEAIAAHQKALELDPQLGQAHANLIILYGKAKRPKKAEEHYRAAVNLNPNHADSHYNYGVVLFEQGRFSEAEQAFRKALEANPFHPTAYHNLGYLLERQGRLDEAVQHYQKALERRPNYREAHFHLGRILVNQKRFGEAIRHFLQTLTPEDDSTPTYLYALAAAYARAGDRQNALSYGRRAREQAAARGQAQLLSAIERDLQTLEQQE